MIANVPTHAWQSASRTRVTKASSGEALLTPFVLTEHTLAKSTSAAK